MRTRLSPFSAMIGIGGILCLALAADVCSEEERTARLKKTAAKNGVELTISLATARFQSGEDIIVKGQLKNVSGKDLFWYRTNRHDLRMIHVESGDVWVTVGSRLPPPAAAPPARETFKPGAVVELAAPLSGKEKMVRTSDKLEDARLGLPAGRYRLEYSTTFNDHYPESGKPVYEGKLAIEPIAFELLENDAKSGSAP